jgi:phage nucleotide-binding protein
MVQVVNADDIKLNSDTYLIYGAPGMGKTSTVRHLPGKTLVLDVDRTSRVLKGYKNIDIAYVDNQDTWKEWGKLIKDLSENYVGKYDNIVLDNISELERCILANLGRDGKNNRVPSIANYQQMQFFLVDSVRFLKSLGSNVVITAWETTDLWTTEDGQQFNRSYPQISAKILTNVMGLCDVVGRIVYNPKSDKRGFYLQPTNSVFAKNQLDNRKFCLQEELMNVGDVTHEESE